MNLTNVRPTDFAELINKDLKQGLLKLFKVTKSGKRGRGVFASRDIGKDEEVIKLLGPIVNNYTANTLYWSYGIDVLIQVGKDRFILPNNESRFFNHSCDPNMGFKDRIFVAMRKIKKGEELTFDYGMTEIADSDWSMPCYCETKKCRKIITSNDIFNKKFKLVSKYKGYLPKFIEISLRKAGLKN